MCHTEAQCAALQEVAQTVSFCVQVIPFLCFRRIFAGIETCLISPEAGVEWQNVDGRGAEHHQVQVVWVDPLVVLLAASLACDALSVRVVLLLRLLWPRKEESASAAILQAVLGRTSLQVEAGLYDPC